MAQTYLSNVLQIFYDLEKWTPINNIVAQGVVGSNLITGNLADAKIGKTITKSFERNIDRDLNFVTVETESGTITPTSISSYTASFPYQLKSAGITSTEFEAIYKGLQGNDQAILKQLGGLRSAYLRKQQADLKALMDVTLVSGGALEDHTTIAYNSSTFDGSNVRKAITGFFGEKAGKLGIMIVHSKVKNAMRTNKLLGYIQNTTDAGMFFADPVLNTFNNMIVVENDTVCAETGSGTNIYPIYCMSRGALDIEYSSDLRLTEVTSTIGGGTMTKQWTGGYGVYIPGLTYGSTSITDANVFDGSNWTTAWDISEIDICRIDVQGE